MKPVTCLLALAAALGLPAAAHAVSFSQADRNGDGWVTFDEAERVLPRLKQVHFDKSDRRGDGRLDQGEFAQLNNFYWIVYKEGN